MTQPRPGRMPTLCQPGIEEYAERHTSAEPPIFRELAGETVASTSAPQMMVGHLEGRFLKMLVAMLRPMHIVEIGTFTGYSSLSMAEALPPGGRITCLDISEKHAAIARRYHERTGYADRIEVLVAPALTSLENLPGPFDLVFIDADKENYRNYYEAVLPRLSPHGIIAVDNVLWSGRILDDMAQDRDTVAMRAFNDFVASDARVEAVMLTVRDGVTLVRKRPV
jgi:caffeoyl-CoA O-methyltransferase